MTLVTHVRNRPNIEKAGSFGAEVDYIDTEWLAAPLHRLSQRLRGSTEVAWSTAMILQYPAYLAFELQAWRRHARQLKAGAFDLVHRITPMSPTLPSPIAARSPVPFVLGPLNGNLDWPAAYRSEQRREKERARVLRTLYKALPHARSTQRKPACILAAFEHTRRDLGRADPARILSFPEVGVDHNLFHARGRRTPFTHGQRCEFLFAGRLVPYKLAEVVIRAVAGSTRLQGQRLRIIGDGPERGRLTALVEEFGIADTVRFEGRKTQAQVADAMRRADAFVFPSIRELGAGVVVEAMACGALPIVVDYGAPGALVANGLGVALPLAPMDALTRAVGAAMEACLDAPAAHAAMAEAAALHAARTYSWQAKARFLTRVYDAILAGTPLQAVSAEA